MGKIIQVFTTLPTEEEAEKLALRILEEKLGSCVQKLGPLRSFYWWKGKIEKEKEWLLIIKTTEEKFSRLEKFIKKNHPYEIPEIISVPVLQGNPEYLKWLEEELS